MSNIVWLSLATQGAQTELALCEQLGVTPAALCSAVERLCADGRVLPQGAEPHAQSFETPVGSEEGWEAAVCDHFRAVATGIAAKLSQGASQASDRVGGTTLSFTVHAAHPKKDEVYGLLKTFREQAGELWREVAEYNRAHSPPAGADKVTFYFGQDVTPQAVDVEPAMSVATEQP